jgi:hypothetical protein
MHDARCRGVQNAIEGTAVEPQFVYCFVIPYALRFR